MSDGFIKLWRSSLDTACFKNAELWKVWCWCLMKAAYKESHFSMQTGRGETIVSVGPGQFIFGRHKAAEELLMPPTSVQRRIKKLTELGQISVKPVTHFSIITVLNWDKYQCDDLQNGSATVNQRSTNGHIQEGKEEKNIAPSPTKAGLEPVIKMPTNRFETIGEEVPVYQDSIDLWQETFPGIDVVQELKKARSWAVNNKSRRKTTNGMMKFLNGWMERAQNSSKGNGQPANDGKPINCKDCIGFDLPTATCGKNNPATCRHFSRK